MWWEIDKSTVTFVRTSEFRILQPCLLPTRWGRCWISWWGRRGTVSVDTSLIFSHSQFYWHQLPPSSYWKLQNLEFYFLGPRTDFKLRAFPLLLQHLYVRILVINNFQGSRIEEWDTNFDPSFVWSKSSNKIKTHFIPSSILLKWNVWRKIKSNSPLS